MNEDQTEAAGQSDSRIFKKQDDRGALEGSPEDAHASRSPAPSFSEGADISLDVHSPHGTRILPPEGKQLVPGVNRGTRRNAKASKIRSVVKRGRKRGARSMGRYPFLTMANKILDKTRWYKSHGERGRKFRLLNRIAEGCYARKEISTLNPAEMTETDVGVLIGAIKNGNNKDPGRKMRAPATSRKMIHFLEVVCDSAKNGVVGKVLQENPKLIPREAPDEPIDVLTLDDLQTLVGGDWHLEDEWWDITGHMATCFYSGSGVRVGEGRTQDNDGFDLAHGVVHVTHPKGEGVWTRSGEPRSLMLETVAMIREYQEIRADKIRSLGYNLNEIPWFFIYVSEEGTIGEWNERVWNKLKNQIVQHSCVKFQWKILRATFGQKTIDDGTDWNDPNSHKLAVQSVSQCMGHRKTETTEKFYARIRKDPAFSHIREAWKPLSIRSLKPQNQFRGD